MVALIRPKRRTSKVDEVALSAVFAILTKTVNYLIRVVGLN